MSNDHEPPTSGEETVPESEQPELPPTDNDWLKMEDIREENDASQEQRGD